MVPFCFVCNTVSVCVLFWFPDVVFVCAEVYVPVIVILV